MLLNPRPMPNVQIAANSNGRTICAKPAVITTDAKSRPSVPRRPDRPAPAGGGATVSREITIALDAMGGARAPEMVLRGAEIALQRHPGLRFMIFGEENQLRPLLAKLPQLAATVELHHTSEVVMDDDKPSMALRSGRQTSMRLAIDAVAEGLADGVVSAGNTGALMAMAKF